MINSTILNVNWSTTSLFCPVSKFHKKCQHFYLKFKTEFIATFSLKETNFRCQFYTDTGKILRWKFVVNSNGILESLRTAVKRVMKIWNDFTFSASFCVVRTAGDVTTCRGVDTVTPSVSRNTLELRICGVVLCKL